MPIPIIKSFSYEFVHCYYFGVIDMPVPNPWSW